jgi:hypothetical protein
MTTYLMNSSRQEFICIEKTDPTTIGEYLKRLEAMVPK